MKPSRIVLGPGLHRLIYGLLYPAALGAVFLQFIQEDLFSGRVTPRLAFAYVFMFHWSVEFVSSTIKSEPASYTLGMFLQDIGIVVAMYMAFRGLPGPLSPQRDFADFYVAVGCIGLIYSVYWTMFHIRRGSKRREWNLVLTGIDYGLAVAGFTFAFSEVAGWFQSNPAAWAYFFVTLTLLASLGSLWTRRDRIPAWFRE